MKKRSKNDLLFDFDSVSTKLNHYITRDLSKAHADACSKKEIVPSTKLYMATQISHTLKQYVKQSCSGEEDEKAKKTYKKFYGVNDHISNFSARDISFPSINRRVTSSGDVSDKILIRARAIVHSLLTPFTQKEWDLACRNSKGSSIGVPYVDTSDERKFKYPISCTVRVKRLFNYYLQGDSRLRAALTTLNEGNSSEIYDVVKGSRATTVPKNDDVRRFIAIEPTLNMFFQQGLMEMMYKRMKSKFLDVNSLPDIHRKLAYESSITSRNATIDFSQASDCTSIDLARFLLPRQWFHAIDQTRSPTITIDGVVEELNMISTMGNAVTFPLETIIFWALGHASVLEDQGSNTLFPEWEDLRRVSVFGDDCILPTENAQTFMNVCEYVGYIVNKEKSFYDQKGFRESCGGDYYRGVDVRPFHLKSPNSNRKSSIEPWLYTCVNKVLKKYIQYFGPLTYVYDKEFFRYIFYLFDEIGVAVKPVPPYFPDDSGLKTVDLDRLAKAYRITLSPVFSDKHGTKRFHFCNFRYRSYEKRSDDLKYTLWLRRPAITSASIVSRRRKVSIPRNEDVFDRRVGSYVVGVGLASDWS